MRITNSMMIDNLLTNINGNMSKVAGYSGQLSSNRKIVSLSDDPIGVFSSLTARSQIYRLDQYRDNVDSASSWAAQAETAVYEMEEITIQVRELLVQSMSTTNASDKQNIATQVNELIEHMYQISNATMGTQYIFGGFNTSQEPFETIRNEDGDITGVLYNGLDLTLSHNDVLTASKIENTTNAQDFLWDGEMTGEHQTYTITATGADLSLTDEFGNVINYTVTAADVTNGMVDLTAHGLGTISFTNKVDPPITTPEEIATAIASAGNISTQSAAVTGARTDSHLTWTGTITANDKFQIAVEGDTLIFYNRNGVEQGRHQVTAADLAAGEIDLTPQGLGRVTWDTADDPLSIPPYTVPTTPEELAELVGSAEFVTSVIGEEQSQHIQFEIGYGLKQDVSFNGIELVGIGDEHLFSVLINIRDDLRAGARNEDLTKYLSDIDKIQDNLLIDLVTSGARTEQLETLESRYTLDAINYEEVRSGIEDIDQAETIMYYQYSNTIFKQALASGSQIIQMSLMDFLK